MKAEQFTDFIGLLIDNYEWATYTAIVFTVIAICFVLYKIMSEEMDSENQGSKD